MAKSHFKKKLYTEVANWGKDRKQQMVKKVGRRYDMLADLMIGRKYEQLNSIENVESTVQLKPILGEIHH